MQTKILIRSEIIEKLKEIVVFDQYVSTDIEVRSNYSRDMTEQVAPALTDVIVLPENRLPLAPALAGAIASGGPRHPARPAGHQ